MWDFRTARSIIHQHHPQFFNGGFDAAVVNVPSVLSRPLLVNNGRLIFVVLSNTKNTEWFKESKWLKQNACDDTKKGGHIIGFLQQAHLVMSANARPTPFMLECQSASRVCLEGPFTPITPTQKISSVCLEDSRANYFPIVMCKPLRMDPRFKNVAKIIKTHKNKIIC